MTKRTLGQAVLSVVILAGCQGTAVTTEEPGAPVPVPAGQTQATRDPGTAPPASPDAPIPDQKSVLPSLSIGPTSTEIATITAAEILGTLAYGIPSPDVAYSDPPPYRAFQFKGAAGDYVRASVTGSANAYVWIVDSAGTALSLGTGLTHATLPTTGDYLLVFRETTFEDAHFVALVDLDVAPPPPPPPPPAPPPPPSPVGFTPPPGWDGVAFTVDMYCSWSTESFQNISPVQPPTAIASGMHLESVTVRLISAPGIVKNVMDFGWGGTGIAMIPDRPLSNLRVDATSGPDVPGVDPDISIAAFIDDAARCSWANFDPSRTCWGARPLVHPDSIYTQSHYGMAVTATANVATYGIRILNAADGPEFDPYVTMKATVSGSTVALHFDGWERNGTSIGYYWHNTCDGTATLQ